MTSRGPGIVDSVNAGEEEETVQEIKVYAGTPVGAGLFRAVATPDAVGSTLSCAVQMLAIIGGVYENRASPTPIKEPAVNATVRSMPAPGGTVHNTAVLLIRRLQAETAGHDSG